MSSAYATDLSQYPISISGDQIVQNIIQVAQSDGVDAVSLDHDFYGVSQDGRVFSMACFRVVESGPNTNTGTLELHIYNSDGVSVPILTIGEDGTTIEGSLNVKGGHTSLETTSVVVEDKDMVLASGATSVEHLDQGGIILGTDESGTKDMLYDLGGDVWKSNIGVNVDADAAFTVGTVGDAQTILDGTGLTIGDVSLTDGSLQLAPDISLGTEGLEIGDISVTPLGGLVMGSADGSDVDPTVVLDESGLYLKNTEAALYLGQAGWKIAYDSSSQHLLFEFYDADSSSYVTKAEFKA